MLEANLNSERKNIASKESWDKGKLAILALFALYFLDVAFRYKDNWCLVDGMNIWIHEAGHFLFMIFGSEFLTIAGGTLSQILMPLMFIAYFYFTEQKFSAALTVFWLGESVVNVSVYMADAVDMALPLIGGNGTEGHDWHNMFSMLGVLPMTQPLSAAVRMLGVMIIFFAIAWGITLSRKERYDISLDRDVRKI